MYRWLIPMIIACLNPGNILAQVGVPTFPTQQEIDSMNAEPNLQDEHDSIDSIQGQLEESSVDIPVVEPLDIDYVKSELERLKKKNRKKLNPLLTMNNHNTLFFGQPAMVWGAKVGLELLGSYRMGVGAYYLPKPIAMDPILEPGARDTTYRRFRIHYYNTFMEFVLIKNYRWELSLPFSLGYGIGLVQRWSPGQEKWVKGPNKGGFVSTFSLNAHYSILSWLGVGVGLGYRQILSADSEIQRDISGLTYNFKVKIFLKHLYWAIFDKRPLLEEKGDYRYQKYLKKQLKYLRRKKR